MRARKRRYYNRHLLERKEKEHDNFFNRVYKDPMILNESGILNFEERKIVGKVYEPRIDGYTADIGLLYEESSGRYVFMFIDVKTALGESVSKWDKRLKKIFKRDYIHMRTIKTRYFNNLSLDRLAYDIFAIVDNVGQPGVHHPIWFKKQRLNAEYYCK